MLPGAARRQVTFLASPRKVTKRRRPQVRRPSGSLRCSQTRAAAELGLVAMSSERYRLCSPSDSPRGPLPRLLRCSATLMGTPCRNAITAIKRCRRPGFSPGPKFTNVKLGQAIALAWRSSGAEHALRIPRLTPGLNLGRRGACFRSKRFIIWPTVNSKLQHWRALQPEMPPRPSPVLDFHLQIGAKSTRNHPALLRSAAIQNISLPNDIDQIAASVPR